MSLDVKSQETGSHQTGRHPSSSCFFSPRSTSSESRYDRRETESVSAGNCAQGALRHHRRKVDSVGEQLLRPRVRRTRCVKWVNYEGARLQQERELTRKRLWESSTALLLLLLRDLCAFTRFVFFFSTFYWESKLYPPGNFSDSSWCFKSLHPPSVLSNVPLSVAERFFFLLFLP